MSVTYSNEACSTNCNLHIIKRPQLTIIRLNCIHWGNTTQTTQKYQSISRDMHPNIDELVVYRPPHITCPIYCRRNVSRMTTRCTCVAFVASILHTLHGEKKTHTHCVRHVPVRFQGCLLDCSTVVWSSNRYTFVFECERYSYRKHYHKQTNNLHIDEKSPSDEGANIRIIIIHRWC